MSQSLQCMLCKHYLGGGTCAAFRFAIPEEILAGEFDHREAYEGDGGIRWEPANARAAEIAADMDADDEAESA